LDRSRKGDGWRPEEQDAAEKGIRPTQCPTRAVSRFKVGGNENIGDECLRPKLEGAKFGKQKAAKRISVDAPHRQLQGISKTAKLGIKHGFIVPRDSKNIDDNDTHS
jgi:hypothetical protein